MAARKPGSTLEAMRAHVLDHFKPDFGILNCLYGAQVHARRGHGGRVLPRDQ